MAQSNKILTVSYGTFSCTLEGFDNPFAAMQSIAEYFRDLAAEDRYFGAEPPQPDAQMLHQIAEREVRRRVETRVAESGVVLRQMDQTDAGQPAAPTEPAAPETEHPPGSEAVADRLARIRAAAAKARAKRDRTYEEDELVEDESLLTAFAKADDAEIAEEARFSVDALADRIQPSSTAAEQSSAHAPPEAAHPAAPSQIRAARQVGDAEDVVTVATGLTTAPAQKAEADPPVAMGPGEKASQPEMSDPIQEPAQSRSEVEEPVSEAPTGAPDDGSAAMTAPDARSDADTDEEANRPAGDSRDEDVELASLMAVVAAAETTSASRSRARDEVQSEGKPVENWIDVEVEEDDGTPRTIRMSRTAFENALASGELEEIDGDQVEAPVEDAILGILSQTSLSDADAAALAAELAEVEREAAASDTSADGDETLEVEDIRADDAPKAGDNGNRTVTRLLDETNAQMGEPEGYRRRTAIQHLRAAVWATKAAGGPRDRSPAEDASLQKFRADLQKVVHPSRAEMAGEAANPLDPLVLVSSQRVDTRVEPVRTVRHSTTPGDMVEPEGKETFLEFAAKLGARDLPDLLEAAAAYSKIVEGQEGAPRPVLIRRATEAAPAGSATREEGLKSFGQLLRSGRIRKVEAGRFALADDAEIEKKARAVR